MLPIQVYVFLSQDVALVAAGSRYGDGCSCCVVRLFLLAAVPDDGGGGQKHTLSEGWPGWLRIVVQVVTNRQQTTERRALAQQQQRLRHSVEQSVHTSPP